MAVNKAINERAAVIMTDIYDSKVLNRLIGIEEGHTDNPQFAWKTMRQLGKYLKQLLTPEQYDVLSQTNHLRVLSSLPVGIAILPENNISAPLGFFMDITYEPISPLTYEDGVVER